MPEFVFVNYASELARGIEDSYCDRVDYSTPQTAVGWVTGARLQRLIARRVEGAYTTSASTVAMVAMRAFLQANPDPLSTAWCAHREGGSILPYPYVGQYVACVVARDRVLDQQRFDCAHCAMVKAKEILTARNQLARGFSVMLVAPGQEIPEDYINPPFSGVLEIATESRQDVHDTSTIKDYTGSPGYACGNCGRLGHNSRGCTHPEKNFDRIGVEVEGRFFDLRSMRQRADSLGATYSGDGSIRESPDSNAKGYEFKTKPGSLRETIEQVVAMYPDETDASCGMHIHMSFPQDCLTLFHTTAFFAYFVDRWRKWGNAMGLHHESEFFKRLNGDNNYCLPNDTTRVDMTNGERYEHLNFTAWRGHKTLECRLLPMFRRSSLAVAAIQELVAIYEDFLADVEAAGLEMPATHNALVDISPLVGCCETLPAQELDYTVDFVAHRETHKLELTELAPPAENMVRIALPVNQSITVEALSARLTALRAA